MINEAVEKKIASRQELLKRRYPTRVWICVGCDHVMGVFTDDFLAIDINSQRVEVRFSGSITRKCHRCERVNDIATRQHMEEIEGFIQKYQEKLAAFKSDEPPSSRNSDRQPTNSMR